MTKKQQFVFWPVFAAACRELGYETKEEKEEYRHRLMWEASRARHLADVSPTDGFERMMSQTAIDAGDYETASKYSIGEERRMGAIIDDVTRQILELEGKDASTIARVNYAIAVLLQAGWSQVRNGSASWWMDFAPDKPVRIFQMLDTHRRRLLKRRGAVKGSLGYSFGRRYSA